MFDAVVGVLSQLAGGGGLVVVLEDLQWADEPTLRALVHVARARPPVGLLVVGTYRDTELIGRDALTAALGELSLQSDVTRLRLAGLDAGEVAALVAAIGPDNLPRLAEIDRRSGGNPFFVMALAELATSSAIPSAVRDVVRGRMRRLTPGAQPIVAAAATLGEDLDPLVVSAAVEQPVDRVLAAFDEAQDAGITREVVTNLPHLTGGGTGGENALPGQQRVLFDLPGPGGDRCRSGRGDVPQPIRLRAASDQPGRGRGRRSWHQHHPGQGGGLRPVRVAQRAGRRDLRLPAGDDLSAATVRRRHQRADHRDGGYRRQRHGPRPRARRGRAAVSVGIPAPDYTNFHSFILGGIIIITVVLVLQGATSFAPDAWRARRVPFLDTIRSYRL